MKKKEPRIIFFEESFRVLGRMMDDMLNWIMETISKLPAEAQRKILEEMLEKTQKPKS